MRKHVSQKVPGPPLFDQAPPFKENLPGPVPSAHPNFGQPNYAYMMFIAFRDADQKTFVCSYNNALIMSSLTTIMACAIVNSQGSLSHRTIEAHNSSL